jgi:superfamily I DNA/RNA helicase
MLQPHFEDAFAAKAAALDQLLAQAAEYKHDTSAFLKNVSLGDDTDMISDKVQKVSLLTMHAAKGLEFDVVFVAGCEQGLLPYSPWSTSVGQVDEERRLFYVAMTRARHQLFLTYARRRAHFGKPIDAKPSPFLKDIENRLKTHQAPTEPDSYRKPNKQRQLGLFDTH